MYIDQFGEFVCGYKVNLKQQKKPAPQHKLPSKLY